MSQATPPIKDSRIILSQAGSRRNNKSQHDDKLIGRRDIRLAKGSGNAVTAPAKGFEKPGAG